MIKRLVYNKKAFKILDGFTIKQSNAEVTFNDITIDFTGYSLLDIPFKYQELKIIQAETEEEILNENGEVVFTGFLDDIDLSEMKIRKEEQRELTLTVLSPLAMSTKRYVSLIGTYSKEEAIRRVLQPLLDDGFKIIEFNIPTGQITTNFVIESVENCMNDMCFKVGIFWFIDENKNIYINSIDYLFGLGTKKTIAPDVITKGISKIQPKIENIDYANVINFKNVRLFYSTSSLHDDDVAEDGEFPLLNLPKKINKGDTIQFNNPVVVDEKTLRTIAKEYTGISSGISLSGIQINVEKDDLFAYADIGIETNDLSDDFGKYVKRGNCSFNDDAGEEAQIVLQRDSFFKNLITGFKWNGVDGATITAISSVSALRYTTMRFMYSAEINNLKGVISSTGIVEKCIDYQEKWTTTMQLIDYARSLMSSNTKTINQVDLTFDEKPNLKIGNIVEIYEPDFYIDGKFAVKEISYKYINDENEEWNIKLKNSDLNSTYIDLFRPAQKQENESKTDTVVLSEYVEEAIYEKHEIGEKKSLTGDVIVIKDDDGLISIEKINGSHSQKTTVGRNLFNVTDYTKLNTGLNSNATISKKSDSIIITTANLVHSGFYMSKTRMAQYIKDADTTKKYTISADVEISADCNFRFGWETNNTYQQVKKGRFRTKCNANSINCSFVCYTKDAAVTIKVTNFMVSLSEDSTFEEFTDGPSPNANCQQEVETVGDNVNLLNNTASTTSINGIDITVFEDKTVLINGTATENTNFFLQRNLLLEDGKEYTLNSGNSNASSSKFGLYINQYYENLSHIQASYNSPLNFTYNIKSKDTNSIYVYIHKGVTVENELLKPKLEKGSTASPYSMYNRGCVEIIKRNKNQLSLPEQTGISNGVTHHYKDGTVTLQGTLTNTWATAYSKRDFFLKAGTYIASLSHVDKEFEIRMYLENGKTQSFWLAKAFLRKPVTFEADVIACYMVYHHATKGEEVNISIDIQLETGEKYSDFIIPKQEVFIVPTQQELLGNDYIDDVEHHEWDKLILTGEENWYCESNGRMGYLVQYLPNAYKKTVKTSDLLGNLCNSYIEKTPSQTWNGAQGFCIDPAGSLRIWDDTYSKTSDLAGFKAMLAEKYNSGNPVICYLKLAEPYALELTDEQKKVIEQIKKIQSYNGETILMIDGLATITASYTKKEEGNES